jgi:hypothetical protein
MEYIKKILTDYVNGKTSINDVKLKLSEVKITHNMQVDRKIEEISILLDSYDQLYAYKNNNSLVYALKKISHALGIGEDPITENEIRSRIKKMVNGL